ncbi:HNH endonuclease [Xanthocytophaga agilis]|uniref:HNH endonuclease n=1 Tax=Xanthocytophaga agilis TaxID=3048010 RepID=A0AAE3RAA7_9BACT|nr:HNH endonuclease [Xanthocytophaga agilis]MDJ1503633.1 HNH endonuclease [Xanthocytophaga agilis]
MKEVWKTIMQHQSYEVSNRGNVRRKGSTKHRTKVKINSGYLTVSIYNKNTKKSDCHLIHLLVLESFTKRPVGNFHCDHINHDPTNNKISNLRWMEYKDNIRNRSTTKLNKETVNVILHRYENENITQKELAKEYSITQAMISYILNNKMWL